MAKHFKHPVRIKREELGFSVEEFAELTGLSSSTIRRIEGGLSEHRVNQEVAKILATAFSCKVSDLFDSSDLSHLGRPPLTGRPLSVTTSVTIEFHAVGFTSSLKIETLSVFTICEDCRLQLPSTGECGFCY